MTAESNIARQDIVIATKVYGREARIAVTMPSGLSGPALDN
jgi:hypothetical protein